MWLQFALALPVCFVFLYVPGYFFSRALSYDPIASLALAPLATSIAYAILAIAYAAAGIYTTWVVMLLPLSAASVLFWAFSCRKRENSHDAARARHASHAVTPTVTLWDELQVYLPYIVVGLAICLYFFVRPLDGPDSFTWRTDNTKCINLIWRYAQSGNWSTLATSLYEDTSIAPLGGSFYPASWHLLAAMVTQALGISAACGANVLNTVLIGITIPTSSYLLVRTALGDKPFAVRLGAIFPLAFGVFPWHIIIPEAKEAFFFGLSMAPACISVFVMMCEEALEDGRPSLRHIAMTIVCLLACAMGHPSVDFAIGILLVPYIMWTIWRASADSSAEHGTYIKPLALEAAFVAFVIVAWVFFFNIPAVHSVTMWMHPAYLRPNEALLRVVFVGFKDVSPQPWLALMVWTGVAYSLYRKKYLWLSCGFLTFSFFYFVDAITDAPIKRYLTGFWYTDFNRVAACACIIAVPLAALGLYAWVRLAQQAFSICTSSEAASDEKAAPNKFRRVTIPLLITTVLLGVIYYPSFHMPQGAHRIRTAFGYTVEQARKFNSTKKSVLDEDEREFLDEVDDVVGDDLVINFPLDGSCFAYATDDMNVYFRRYYKGQTYESKVIMARLYAVASDGEVQAVLHELDAHYILLLDVGCDINHQDTSSVYWDKYDPSTWAGFTNINDNTPGLTIVLSKGDMRLYRIDE